MVYRILRLHDQVVAAHEGTVVGWFFDLHVSTAEFIELMKEL
jgi:hypothetical protein